MSQADADEQTADEHDSESCACGACQRTRERDASRVRAREASVRGGLFPQARELFGDEWIDGFEQGQGATMEVGQLAQHALGNIFEELERLGETTRKKLLGERYAATPPASVNRADIATALNYAESLIEFGRAQLGYLPESPFRLNTQVAVVVDGFGDTIGTFVGVSKGGLARVFLPRTEANADGTAVASSAVTLEVPLSTVREVAV